MAQGETALTPEYTAFFSFLVGYFVYHRIGKGLSGGKTWMLAFTLLSYALAVVFWALDIRILYLELYRLMPQQLSSSPDSNLYDALYQDHGVLLYVQVIIVDVIVSSFGCLACWISLSKTLVL